MTTPMLEFAATLLWALATAAWLTMAWAPEEDEEHVVDFWELW